MANEVEKIGNKVIQCPPKCLGMRNNPSENYYPRGLFLENDISEANVAIVGLNPGHASSLEREFYKFVAEQNTKTEVAYKNFVRISRAISKDHKYHQWPQFLLKELGITPTNILWGEIAFCEKDPDWTGKEEFKKALDICSKKYLNKIVRLLKGAYIICLGRPAYKHIYQLTHDGDKWKNEWKDAELKIIGVWHPTGSRLFGRYFEGKGKITERKLKKSIKAKFEKLEHQPNYSEFL